MKARNDLNWHRSFVWLSGFSYKPEFRYTLSIWSLPTTQQTLVFGNMFYRASQGLTLGLGIAPNLTARSTTGSWPMWAGSDRQMSEEFFRAGFSSGVFITGEFGPRGGFGDLEEHQEVATRFGVSACHATEGRGAPVGQPNNETQLRLSDGVYLFEEGALANGVTVKNADYDYLSFDAAAKYRGFCIFGEVYARKLSNFDTTGPVPDDFERKPWEVAGGASYYPYGSRSWRLNLHVIRVEKSPTGSSFGYYTAGQSGTTISLGADILL